MIVYWVLLLLIAFVAYLFGCLDTLVLASNFVFHRNLRRLGDSRVWLSNFYRLFGVAGFLKLAAVELVKDLVPILLGALLLGLRGHADVGRAFAGFVLVLGRLWPATNRFRGSHGIYPFLVAAIAVESSVGIAAALVALAVTALTRYASLGAFLAALSAAVVAVLMVDDALLLRLLLLTALLVILRHIPALIRIFRRREPKISFEKDITYKLDE